MTTTEAVEWLEEHGMIVSEATIELWLKRGEILCIDEHELSIMLELELRNR